MLLAEAANGAQQGPLADFHLEGEEAWREFRIGAWLHDCGKVTTPEYVVDKATKLETNYNRIRSLVNEELKQYFRPEFLNRLDEIIVFRQLSRDEVKEIAEIMLKEVFGRMSEKGIHLSVTDAFKERLVEEGYNPSYGARPLRRAVMRLLEDSLAEEFLSGRIGEGDSAVVDVDDNKQVVIRKEGAMSMPTLAGVAG